MRRVVLIGLGLILLLAMPLWAYKEGLILDSTQTDCDQTTQKVTFTASTKSFGCGVDAGGAAGGALVAVADLSVTMTNIGTSYKDIYSAAFQPDFHSIDFTNFTSCRMLNVWDYVGTGTQQVRFADAADNANVLIEGTTFTADCDPCATGWVTIPAAFQGATKTIEWQGKSTTSTDDPAAKGFRLYCK